MSIWTTLSGSVSIRESSGVSLRKLVKGVLGTTEFTFDSITQESFSGFRTERFHVVFCNDGMPAATLVQVVVDTIKSKDPSARVDILAEIRWLA